ncbi:DUF6191 domain-containing protein [Kitasatospora sp. NPDC048722]|uniref:DUF6191 domain-containing protein n=1 Tax=Kitasatospora sp. NPDC048722 TaxID=3155639 RepID=UPI0033F521ED
MQLEQRRVELALRDDEHDGAPKRTGIDLADGRAVIRQGGGAAGRRGAGATDEPATADS